MLFDGSSAEADATLRAMKEVATARGAHPLSDPDWVALSAAHTVVFRGVGLLDTEALPDITSAALADALAPDHREHAAAFLAVMATVDGAVDAARIETADAFVDALGLHESYLRDLGALAQRKFAEVRADVARHNVRSFTGVETNADFDGESLDEWLNVYREHPDPELHARFDALRAAPVGTFGRTFADFYADNGFVFPGVPESANQQFVVPHDSAHVLSGYDTSVQGEILVSAFTAGMHPDDAVSAHVLPVIMVFHLGIPMNDFAGSSTGALDPRKFWVAWSRGDQITGDTLSHDWDFWAHVDQPLDAVRAVMGVAPLDPADAADGEYPDWYHANA